MVALPLKAQNASQHIAVQFSSDETVFYDVDASGHFERLDELTDLFATIKDDWYVLNINLFSLSPDSQKLAFVAYHFDQQMQQQETTLFIYTFGHPHFQQIPLSGMGAIMWSPQSDAIALVGQPQPDGAIENLDSIYIVDLASARVFAVPDSPPLAGNVLWLPDDVTLVYAKTTSPCRSETCLNVRNLFAINRLTLAQSTLTHLETAIPASTGSHYMGCSPSELSWSQNDNRIYYSLRCTDVDEDFHDTLYSVNLNADNRFEGIIAAIQNDKETLIKNIHSNRTKQGVYLTIMSRVEQPIDSGRTKEVYDWHIFYVDGVGNIQPISDIQLSIKINLTDVAISPDENQIALSGMDDTEAATGYLWVVDLTTGKTKISKPTLQEVCQVEWLNNHELLYSQYSEGFCGASETTWKLNIENNSTENMTANLEGPIWILPTAD